MSKIFGLSKCCRAEVKSTFDCTIMEEPKHWCTKCRKETEYLEIPKLTKEQAIILSAYTGILLLKDVHSLYEYIEDILGRSFINVELASEKMWEEIKEKSKEDFKMLIYEGKDEQ